MEEPKPEYENLKSSFLLLSVAAPSILKSFGSSGNK
jgi:hypothetical protein